MSWGVAFCKGAQIELRQKSKEEDVEKARKAADAARVAYNKVNRMVTEMEQMDCAQFYDAQDRAISQRIAKVNEIVTLDESQAKKFQEDFHSFDPEYFNQYVKLASEDLNVTGSNLGVGGRFSLLSR